MQKCTHFINIRIGLTDELKISEMPVWGLNEA